jgi:3-methyladenine DNA glycosylase AlkD
MDSVSTEVYNALIKHQDLARQKNNYSFFQTQKGGYGEGDEFIGVSVPHQRKVARQFTDLSLNDITPLLDSPWHEVRFVGLVVLVHRFEKAGNEDERKAIYDYYLSHTEGVNNWDLVDTSAHKIVGAYLLSTSDREVLFELAESENMWEQRIAVLATMTLIDNGDFNEIFDLAQKFFDHPHHLMHKAVGWMLREVGKHDSESLISFLKQHWDNMPSIMRSYATEKVGKKWLKQ